MGFNITQIINKFVPTKRVDDDLRENPFQTKYGQEIVSIQEDFEARLLREGRPVNKYVQGNAIPANTFTQYAALYPDPGCEIYPTMITVGTDVDCHIAITYNTGIDQVGQDKSGNIYDMVYLKAGTPLVIQPKGIKVYESGNVSVSALSTTAGKIYASVRGIEVMTNA